MPPYSYPYPRPALSVDCVLLSWQNPGLHTLLIKRDRNPFEGQWALPGGFMDEDEDLMDAANRELLEETALKNVQLRQFRAYGKPNRDPRTRVVTVVFWGLLPWGSQTPKAGDDARDVEWCHFKKLPTLAFDHQEILGDLLQHLRLQIRSQPFGRTLLPREFRMTELQAVYEAFLGTTLNPVDFANQMSRFPHLRKSPAQAGHWQFDPKEYRHLQTQGLSFDPEDCKSVIEVDH